MSKVQQAAGGGKVSVDGFVASQIPANVVITVKQGSKVDAVLKGTAPIRIPFNDGTTYMEVSGQNAKITKTITPPKGVTRIAFVWSICNSGSGYSQIAVTQGSTTLLSRSAVAPTSAGGLFTGNVADTANISFTLGHIESGLGVNIISDIQFS